MEMTSQGLGRVERVITGQDGIIRGATVRVYNGRKSVLLQRPVQKLFPLEIRSPENSSALDQEVVEADQSDGEELTTEGPCPRQAAASHARDQILAQAVSEQID